MNATKQSISSLYKSLRAIAFKDPVFVAVANGTMSWADASCTAEEEARYQEYCANDEGADILNSIQEAMDRRASKKTRRGIQWTEEVESYEVPFEEVKRSAPIQVVTTTVSFNPNQIKTLVARNLPRDVTSSELNDLFVKHGPIRDVYIPKNLDPSSPYYGTIKGFALIKFLSHTDSTRAFLGEQNKLLLRGKMITIEFAKEDR